MSSHHQVAIFKKISYLEMEGEPVHQMPFKAVTIQATGDFKIIWCINFGLNN